MNRITDKPYFARSVYTAGRSEDISVKCPRCRGMGTVTADPEKGFARFHCMACGTARKKDLKVYRCYVENQCRQCGRFYKVAVEKKQQHFPVLRVACPHCGFVMQGAVRRIGPGVQVLPGIRNARDPCFGYELWFLTYLDGKPVWALNREHLFSLIQYLSAGLREKPPGPGRAQGDWLPSFMKLAKNRRRVVKLLEGML